MTIEIPHCGKVNLSLHVEKKRPDGYHSIDTLMQEVAVSDHLAIKKSITTSLVCNRPEVPTDESNLILKAHRALQERCGIGDVRFTLEKRIPMGAGMGGGSANAAAALKGLNRLFDLGLEKEELAAIGLSLGADVPYFLTGGTCRAQGVGEILTPLPAYRRPILLVNDGTHAATKAVYEQGPERTPTTIPLLVEELSRNETRLSVHNDLRKPAFSLYPKLSDTFSKVCETGPETVQLSGTGATIYAIYQTGKEAETAFDTLRDTVRTVILTETRGEDSLG